VVVTLIGTLGSFVVFNEEDEAATEVPVAVELLFVAFFTVGFKVELDGRFLLKFFLICLANSCLSENLHFIFNIRVDFCFATSEFLFLLYDRNKFSLKVYNENPQPICGS